MSEFKAFDFHIHTKKTISDSLDLDFDIERLKKYVTRLNLKAIAITNHNLFDKRQFESIANSLAPLGVVSLPGIELDLEGAHILIISPSENIDSFDVQCQKIEPLVKGKNFSMKLDVFRGIYGNSLDGYLLIPHYKKNPAMTMDTISRIDTTILAGEVQNPKKFELMKKDTEEKLCPVMFSDIRMRKLEEDEFEPSPKITYIAVDDITIPAIKAALLDKGKVSLTKSGKDRFVIDSNFTTASLGLNVVLGKRSSGKTHLLNSIAGIYGRDDTYYIKQFEIINQCSDEEFEKLVNSQFNKISDDYLAGIKTITDAIAETIDDKACFSEIDNYISSLKQFARETALNSIYSSVPLFIENEFNTPDDSIGKEILESIQFLANNSDYTTELSNNKQFFERLFLTVLKKYRNNMIIFKCKNEADEIIRTTKKLLSKESSVHQIQNPRLYKIARSIIINKKYDSIIIKLREPSELKRLEETYGRFRIKVSKGAFKNVTELQKRLKKAEPKADIFDDYYEAPHRFVKQLKDSKNFSDSQLIYRTLLRLDIAPIKDDGSSISKGERAEYVLMQKIDDAKNYKLFLFDEPEPSFDNPFIGDVLLDRLKELSENLTVFMVTHNNTLGASIAPDCIVYTSEDNDGYRTYVGSMTSNKLVSADKKSLCRIE